MAVDPQTGLYSLDVNYQPTGAMGAVTSLLNAQKAQEIADTLQQQRSAQAQHESDLAEEYRRATEESAMGKQAQADLAAKLGHEPTWDERITASLPTQNFKDVIPYATRTTGAAISAGGKVDVEKIKARTQLVLGGIRNGMPVGQAIDLASADLTPAEIQALKSNIPESALAAPAPLPGAKTGHLEAQTKRIQDMTPAEIAALGAKSEYQRAEAEYYRIRKTLKSNPNLGDKEFRTLEGRKNAIDARVNQLLTANFGTAKEDPDTQQQIQNLLAEKKDIDADLAQRKATAPKAPGMASQIGGQSAFGPGGILGGKAPGTAAQASIAPAGKTAQQLADEYMSGQ